MPTTKPRYQLTDSGTLQSALDRAATRWPEVRDDRRELLRRVIELADERLAEEHAADLDAPRTLDEYEGRWVALRGGHVLVACDSAGDVGRWLRSNGQRAEQLFLVPGRDVDVPAEHGLA